MVLPATIYLRHELVFYQGATYGKADMVDIVGPGGTYTATQFAVDNPEGSVVAGDQLRRDWSPWNNGINITVLVMVWCLAKYLVASIEEGIIIVLTTM